MKISTRTRYGVRAMVDLATHYRDKPILVREIAERQSVSAKYLEHIMLALKKAGLVESMSGAKGGYLLMKEPSTITLLDVVKVLEGSMSPVPCVDHREMCDRSGYCRVVDVWDKVREAIDGVLSSVTIKDLVPEDESRDELFYHI